MWNVEENDNDITEFCSCYKILGCVCVDVSFTVGLERVRTKNDYHDVR